MKSFLRLTHIEIENANAIAGMTYGFPAITAFLGFVHALSRNLQQKQDNLKLDGCAIVVHNYQIHTYQPDPWKDSVFCLTRNPPTEEGKPAPFNEEGRMHLIVSLIIECDFSSADMDEALRNSLKKMIYKHRIAGGIIIKIDEVDLVDPPEDPEEFYAFVRKEKRKLLPGFLLVERSDLLKEHFANLKAEKSKAELIDAWLDFIVIKHQAKSKPNQNIGENIQVEWEQMSKPGAGWLVPLNTGYRAISELYAPGQIKNTRNLDTPVRFVESIYTVGQWLSPHRIKNWNHIFWRYESDPSAGWYLCKNSYLPLGDI